MRALLVKTPPGTGKTRAVARALAAHHLNARIVTGTRALAAELAAAHGYAAINGRSQDNCQRYDEVRALGERGHDIEALACGTADKPACPFRETCLYWRQFEQPSPWVGTAEQLFNRHFLQGASLAVVDDAELARSLVERLFISSDDLAKTRDALKGKRREPFRSFLTVLQHALLEVPQGPGGVSKRLTGPFAWDHLQRTATRYGTSVENLLIGLPKAPSLPKPAAEDGVVSRDAIENAPPQTVLALIRALRDEMPLFSTGEDFNSRLRLDASGLEVWRLKDPATDRYGQSLISGMDLLVVDATPVAALVDHLTANHERLSDLVVDVRLPENVSVVQYASSTNGHGVMKGEARVVAMLSEVSAERQLWPAASADQEGAICFKSLRPKLLDYGFSEERVLSFKQVRGTNALKGVTRLHLIGRPMAPSGDLVYLANTIHFGGPPISGQIGLSPRSFGGQPYEVEVVDFADERIGALLRSEREDEMVQAIHRARVFDLSSPQLHLVGEEVEAGRRQVRLVLHTSQPVPGLRIDELVLRLESQDVNAERHEEAAARIKAAIAELHQLRLPVTVSSVIRIAGGSRTTVTKILRTGVHTLKSDLLNKGVYTLPELGEEEPAPSPIHAEEAQETLHLCRGGCGKPMPSGQMCFDCAQRETESWIRQRKKHSA